LRRALIVNAVDIEAAAFRRRRGFIPSKDDPLILFRSIADIAESLRRSETGGRRMLTGAGVSPRF
jgi:hypothetical protein